MWAAIWYYVSGSALLRWLAKRIMLALLAHIHERVTAITADANAAELEAKALAARAADAMRQAESLKLEAAQWAAQHPFSAILAEPHDQDRP